MIEIINVCKTYKAKNRKKTKALKDISLRLPETGMIFITGKSGSGKSTLLNLIGGLDDITSGDIVINGNKFSKFKVDDFANYRSTYVGFIFQDYHILDEFTVKENVELSADISNINCNIEECLKAVDLVGYEDRYPTELSGGQQQRVAIARALAKDSKVILADEPTGNLDNKTTKQILDILKDISKTRLVLIVSHNLDDAARYADRIISLDHGHIVSDLSRIDGYVNEFRIENDTLYLPHNIDLKDDNLKQIINEKDKYNQIIQLNNGMLPTTNFEIDSKCEKLNKSKLSKEKFKKLFDLIFKRSVLSKVFTIIIISVLISLFFVFQSFNSFDENEKLLEHLIEENEDVAIIRKNEYKGVTSSNYLTPVLDEDVNSFKNSNYEGNIYKLYNQSIAFGSSRLITLNYTTIYNNTVSFYATETYGTLNCNEEFLSKLYGNNGKLDVLHGDMYETEHGLIITDYIADSILFYYSLKNDKLQITSYDDLLGAFPKNNYSKHVYINAIINTNYKERYKDLISIYSKLWDNDPTNDNVLDDIKNHDDYQKFTTEVNKYLGISYNFSPNYEKYLYSNENIVAATLGNVNLSYNDKNHMFSSLTYIDGNYINKDLKNNEVILTTKVYNEVFGTKYNKDNLSEFIPHKINASREMLENDYYDDELFVVGLVVSSSYSMYTSEEVFINYLNAKYIPYALYLDSINHIEELSDLINENGYIILNNENGGINIVNRLIQIFGTFLDLISFGFLLICVIYLIHFGYKSIKSNMYEIGIITALGCDNTNMGKLFVYEILSVGVGIIIASFIGMYVAAVSSNYVLINSIEQVFNFTLNNLEIVTFNIKYAIIDLIIAVIIIVISAMFPLLMIRKIKPVNILKAKE